jgi:hypothetical protein
MISGVQFFNKVVQMKIIEPFLAILGILAWSGFANARQPQRFSCPPVNDLTSVSVVERAIDMDEVQVILSSAQVTGNLRLGNSNDHPLNISSWFGKLKIGGYTKWPTAYYWNRGQIKVESSG